jgi:hypothetical protein
MPTRDADQFPKAVSIGGFGHLSQAEIDALRQNDIHQADPIGAGRSGANSDASRPGIPI